MLGSKKSVSAGILVMLLRLIFSQLEKDIPGRKTDGFLYNSSPYQGSLQLTARHYHQAKCNKTRQCQKAYLRCASFSIFSSAFHFFIKHFEVHS